jgi:uroporphyrinogen III methyltransferase/synthase
LANDFGTVYLVGAGPGDVGLLTRRGAELLARAEAVVYDRLVAPEMLALAPDEAERLYVGKSPSHHAMSQEEINALLVRLAQQGRRVVRLKGGDPFVFGRGGEEALTLREAGIPFEIVPGITAGIAGPAYAGIPVTHRGLTSAVVLVTGHEQPGKAESDLDYAALARIGTIVFYMGVGRLDEIARGLMSAGRDAGTPAAVVERATTSRQRTVGADLAHLAQAAAEQGVDAPAIVVVGDVASLADTLAWCDHRPLFGETILVTRTRTQASELSSQLRDLGARVLECPTIAIEPAGEEALRAALGNIGVYQWLVLTSPNGVERFCRGLADCGGDARRLAGVRLAAIGPGTASRLADFGLRADLVPAEAVGESLAQALVEAGAGQGTRVLLARATDARDVVPETLRRAGAEVTEVGLYRTVLPPKVDEAALEAVAQGEVTLVTFTSSSTAQHFARLVEERRGRDVLDHVRRTVNVAAIGPITAATARELGFGVAVESSEHTIAGLVAAIARWSAERRKA